MRVQFWGTRGSIAKAGPATVRYGGNTSCVELRAANGTRLVLDCGTGVHGLGAALLASGEKPLRGHLLIGHTHWDHIQGFPFFAPLFVPGNEWHIYAPHGVGVRLRDTLAGQMHSTYFPVAIEQLGAKLHFHDLAEGEFDLDGVKVTTRYLNHPAPSLGYRVEAGGATVVYATDHEPHARTLAATVDPSRPDPRLFAHDEERRHAEFISGADLLIHDAQYTAAEYASRFGWGHSTVEYALSMARAAGVKRLALFHHDPNRSDDALDTLVSGAREKVADLAGTLEVFAAAEGQVIDLPEDRARAPSARPSPPPLSGAELSRKILLIGGDPKVHDLLSTSLAPEGLTVETIADAGALPKDPPLVVAVAADALQRRSSEVCSALRAHADERWCGVPIVIVGRADDAPAMADAFQCGASDWLVPPCSAPFVASRVRAWRMRMRPRWERAPLPPDEADRLADVRDLALRDEEEPRFHRLMKLTVRALGVPISVINIIDTDKQWNKSAAGLPRGEIPRDIAVCSHTVLREEPIVISDATEHEEFGDNPIFTGELRARFYASVPLRGRRGKVIGTLCVLDRQPRELSAESLEMMQDLARMVEAELRGPRSA